MNIEQIVEIFKKAYPYRKPVKYARVGNIWYIFSENTSNGGKYLPSLIENGWFYIENGKVKPTTPLDMPKNISMLTVPIYLQTPYTPES